MPTSPPALSARVHHALFPGVRTLCEDLSGHRASVWSNRRSALVGLQAGFADGKQRDIATRFRTVPTDG